MNLPDTPFEAARSDRRHGSREIALRLLDDLIAQCDPKESDPRLTARLAHRIARTRPEMALFGGVAARLHALGETSRDPVGSLRSVRGALAETTDRIARARREAALGDDAVMLFSRSGTVLEVLEHPESTPCRAVVLHSYPGGEGVEVARRLAKREDLRVLFAHDAEAGSLLEDVDALYLGADALAADGAFLNKVGSRLLARAAGPTPVRVIASGWKLTGALPADPGPTIPSPERLAESLARDDHPLFERVPPDLVDNWVTERGVARSGDELASTFEDRLAERRRFCRASD